MNISPDYGAESAKGLINLQKSDATGSNSWRKCAILQTLLKWAQPPLGTCWTLGWCGWWWVV